MYVPHTATTYRHDSRYLLTLYTIKHAATATTAVISATVSLTENET